MAKQRNTKQITIRNEVIGLSLCAMAVLSWFAINSEPSGVAGTLFLGLFNGLLGRVAVVLPFFLVYSGLKTMFSKEVSWRPWQITGLLLLLVAATGLMHLSVTEGYEMWKGMQGQGGGILGALTVWALRYIVGTTGSTIILGLLSLIGFILLTEFSLSTGLNKAGTGLATLFKGVGQDVRNYVVQDTGAKKRGRKSKATNWDALADSMEEPIDTSHLEQEKLFVLQEEENDSSDSEELMPVRQKREPRSKKKILPTESITMDTSNKVATYKLPPLSLLNRGSKAKGAPIANKSRILTETLSNFGVEARVINISAGPVVTRYELQLAPGVKVSKVLNLSDDIALSMAATDVRIEAPIPGKAAIGIEVPNDRRLPVTARDVISSPQFMENTGKLTMVLGKDIAGKIITADLQKMVHVLVAGATGSGKSVCMNMLLTSLLYLHKPNEVKLLLIDPKVVELNSYNKIPHLLAPVITDPKKAASSLQWLVNEMGNRYELFASSGVRDLERYNILMEKQQEEGTEGSSSLPYIVVVVDELADLMMTSPTAVEDAVSRLAQMARAAGIHMVMATQRPSVDVVTGLIKANIPSRISFAVSSQVDSRTILDTGGAEKLLGQGDMLYFPVGAPKPLRVQGAFISDTEVEKIVAFWKKQGKGDNHGMTFSPDEVQSRAEAAPSDVLYEQAVEIVLDTEQASISFLQRRLRVGYSRAARLIDEMEANGIVGPPMGSKPRNLLMTKREWEKSNK